MGFQTNLFEQKKANLRNNVHETLHGLVCYPYNVFKRYFERFKVHVSYHV